MDIRAILLLGPVLGPNAPESVGGVPIALLDVLGRPLVRRIADRLRRFEVARIAVIGDVGPAGARFVSRALRNDLEWIPTPGSSPWRAAQRVFSEYAQNGADLTIVSRIGPYAEFDYDQLIQFHLDHNSRVTAASDGDDELLGTFVISTSRRNDAAFLLRHRLQEARMPLLRYRFNGYANRLASAADLRGLTVDAFCGRAQLLPEGTQIRPGVWLGPGARIQRGARVLAPAFIGEQAKVSSSAIITRCSVLEHHSEVDCGTVVENATILPFTTVGAGLDVAHSVVGFSRVLNIRRQVEVSILDAKLVGSALPAAVRTLGHALSLAAFLPLNFVRGLFQRGRARRGSLPTAAQAPSAALSAADSIPAATDPALSNYR